MGRCGNDLNGARGKIAALRCLPVLLAVEFEKQQAQKRLHPLLLVGAVQPECLHQIFKTPVNPHRTGHRQQCRKAEHLRVFRAVSRRARHMDAEGSRPGFAGKTGIMVPACGKQQNVAFLQGVFRFIFRDAPAAIDQINEIMLRQDSVDVALGGRELIIVRVCGDNLPRRMQIKRKGHGIISVSYIFLSKSSIGKEDGPVYNIFAEHKHTVAWIRKKRKICRGKMPKHSNILWNNQRFCALAESAVFCRQLQGQNSMR